MRQLKFILFLSFFSLIACSAGTDSHINKIADEVYAQHSFKQPLPPNEFKSDGCSCWPDSEWLRCCVEHDLSYWRGGTSEERKEADRKLRACVASTGHPVIGKIMYLGVRVGGVYWLPTPFRWGFGWGYPQSGPTGTKY